jgi:hypothetical protein
MADSALMIGTDVETGCYIDGSHWSAFDFSVAVIEFAHDKGFDLMYDQFVKDIEWFRSSGDDEDIMFDILDSLDGTYYDAIDYLNSTAPDNLYWEVEDQSLYLTEESYASQ